MALFRSKDLQIQRNGKVQFLSKHPTVDQLAREISVGLDPAFLPQHSRVLIYVGVHKRFGLDFFRPGFKVAVQTEQFLDQAGNSLWGQRKKNLKNNIFRALQRADVFLDINPQNMPFYDSFTLTQSQRRKLHFGPHIFPQVASRFNPGISPKYAFFGGVKERRKMVLETVQNVDIALIPEGTYGDELYQHISQSKGVANIHFEQGIYTESPRLLTAYLNGKVVLSEELAAPFVSGVHYIPLDDAAVDWDHKAIFERFSQLVCGDLSFGRFLKDIGA